MPEFSLILPISSIFGARNPLEIFNDILLNLFIKCESPKLDVIAEFVSLKL